MRSKQSTQIRSMFSKIASRYDLANTVLSFGIHHLWKYKLSNLVQSKEAKVLDLCTGTGDLLPRLAARNAKVCGADFCFPMLNVAHGRFGDRYPLIQGDALRLPFPDSQFDLVTIGFGVRNFEDLMTGLGEIRRSLKVGGHIAVLEFGQPDGKIFGPLYRWYSKKIMPIIGSLLTGDREAYQYLPETAATFPSGLGFVEKLKEAGFEKISATKLTFGIAYIYLGERS